MMHPPAVHLSDGRAYWLPLVFGLLLVVVYLVFALFAYSYYPTTFSPFHNDTISQLGDPDLNPDGAVLYNIGSSLCGVLAILLFVSLGSLRTGGTRVQQRLVLLVQVLGAIAGFGLIMLAVYPENLYDTHRFFVGVVFLGFGAAIVLSPFALHRPGIPIRWLVYLALVSCAVDIASLAFFDAHWIEWVTVALFMTYLVVMGAYGAVPARYRGSQQLPDRL